MTPDAILAAHLAARAKAREARRLACLSPMARSALISSYRDEMELHPERKRECLARIREIEGN